MNKLILFLLHHLFFVGTMFAAAAPVVIGGGEGDPGADNTGDDPAADHDGEEDPGAADHEDPDGLEEKPEGAEQTEAEKTAAAAKAGKIDGRQLPAKVREMMNELKTADPKAHGFLKDVLFRDRQLSQEFPGGLAEAKKFKETVQSIERDFPGGLDTVKAEISEYRGLDEAYDKADPKVLDIWVGANKEAFNKLMPMAISRFGKEDPEGYQKFGADLITSTLKASGAKHTLAYLGRLIASGDRDGATAELKAFTDWVESIEGLAKKPREAAAQPDPALTARENKVKEQEQQIWQERTSTPINNFRSSFIRKEAAQYMPKGTTLDDETAEAIDAEAQRRADRILMADNDFIKTFSAYVEARDDKGLQAYMKQKIQEVMKSRAGANGKNTPGPIEQATKLFFRGVTPKQVTPKAGTTPGTKTGEQQRQQPAAQGWKKVNPPKPSEIDHQKTPFEMKMKKQAYLTDGRKVYWGTEVPAAG